ncbi:MAG TPA: M28 family peptidase [Candidatus Limiplasma sp.]|nr:M28 family peptidase [Candidatus Limiplasma sp.]HPS80795.1 M28 family peptidase [Candidatus Limiplasma sp.]
MDILTYLQGASTQFGPSGHEYETAQWLKTRFEPLCDSVVIDPLFNVLATLNPTVKPARGGRAPKILMCAHMDEIALMVTDILKDGSLRMGNVGGVDPRILPAATVTVHCRPDSGKPQNLTGVIGAKAPHLLTDEERKQNYRRDDLYIDLGLPVERVRKLVHIGDLVTLNGPAIGLLNGLAAGKTMDDRACVGVMLEAAERLQHLSHAAEIVFACTTQEEVGSRGAKVAAHTVNPDLAIVMDVSHAPIPASRPDTTVPLDAPAATYGPFIQYRLLERLQETASLNGIKLNTEPAERSTGTDTDNVQIAREGIPCVLIDLPLKYMHTTVELLDTNVIRECGRLCAQFAAGIDEGWDDSLWI